MYYSDAFIPWKPLLRVIMYAVFFILSISGCLYISYRFQLKPLEYLDDVAEAARLLATPTDVPVSLPADLKNIEDGSAEFAITVRKLAMGRGYSWYGMEEIIRLAFEVYGLDCVYWCVSRDNKRAVRFYDKHNFHEAVDISDKEPNIVGTAITGKGL